MKKITCTLLALLLCCSFLAACDPDEIQETTFQTPTESAVAEPEAAEAETTEHEESELATETAAQPEETEPATETATQPEETEPATEPTTQTQQTEPPASGSGDSNELPEI